MRKSCGRLLAEQSGNTVLSDRFGKEVRGFDKEVRGFDKEVIFDTLIFLWYHLKE